MSTTRSPSPPAPAIDPGQWAQCALVLAGHGSTRNGGGNGALLRHADDLRARGLFAEVEAAALHGSPGPEEALAKLTAPTVYLAPLLMCDGHCARVVLPHAFGLAGPVTLRSGRRFLRCAPLGLQPGLVRLILARAEARARDEGLAPQAATLLLIGHGSLRDPASRRAGLWLAAGLRAAAVFGSVRAAFLDEPPFLEEALERLAGPAIAVGLFAADGLHAGQDVPGAIARHATVPVHDLGAIGEDPGICDLILDQVAAADFMHRAEPLAM